MKVQTIKDATMTGLTYRVTRDDGLLVDFWYDTSEKLWTIFPVMLVSSYQRNGVVPVEMGAQIGAAEYATTKAEAQKLAETAEFDMYSWAPKRPSELTCTNDMFCRIPRDQHPDHC